MDFEFDPHKSVANKTKHGIDFVVAQSLWLDDDSVEFDVASSTEPRRVVIGKIGIKCWFAVITMRHEVVRLISVRRARKKGDCCL